MGLISRFISISIVLSATAVGAADFSTPFIGAYTDAWTGNTVREYASVTEVEVDFPSTGAGSAIRNTANAIFSQDNAPATIKIGRLGAAVVSLVDITILAAQGAGFLWTFDVNGLTVSYTEITADTPTLIVTALVSAANSALSGVATAATGGGPTVLRLTSVAKCFDLSVVRSPLICTKTSLSVATSFATPDTALTLCAAIDNDWYGLILAQNSEAAAKLVAVWAESNKKLHACCTSDSENETDVSGNLLHDLKAAAYKYTISFFHQTKSEQHIDAAYLGCVLGMKPGTYTGTFKTLSGITVDNLTTTVSGAVLGQYGNTYEEIKDVNFTQQSVTSSGINQDIITLRDYIEDNLNVNILKLYLDNPKISFTDDGISMFRSVILRTLNEFVDKKGEPRGLSNDLSAEPWVTVPKAADVSSAKKAAKTLPDVKFGAYFSGSIEKIEIAGSLRL